MDIGTRVWVKGNEVTRGAEATIVEWPGNRRNDYGPKYTYVEFTGSGSNYVCPVKDITVIEPGTLIPMMARGLNPGDVFYLTAERDFKDTCVEFITHAIKPRNTEPSAGDSSMVTMFRYKGDLGYAVDIIAETPVWLEVEPLVIKGTLDLANARPAFEPPTPDIFTRPPMFLIEYEAGGIYTTEVCTGNKSAYEFMDRNDPAKIIMIDGVYVGGPGEWTEVLPNRWTGVRQAGNLRMNLWRDEQGWFGHLIFKGAVLPANYELPSYWLEADACEEFEKWATTEVLNHLSK